MNVVIPSYTVLWWILNVSDLGAKRWLAWGNIMFGKKPGLAFALMLTISSLAACGAVDQKTPSNVRSGPEASTTQSVRATTATSPTTATTDTGVLPGTNLVPDGMEPITFPPVTVDRDEMIAIALRHTAQREAVLSGSPEVVGTTQATPPYLNAMGLSIGNMSPACLRPMYLVVLKGNFDGRNLVAGQFNQGKPYHVSYVGYLFDQANGTPGSITATFLSADGSAFRKILSDPSLPEPKQTLETDPKPPYVQCIDVTITGGDEATPVATPIP